jgi:hypothetical protein
MPDRRRLVPALETDDRGAVAGVAPPTRPETLVSIDAPDALGPEELGGGGRGHGAVSRYLSLIGKYWLQRFALRLRRALTRAIAPARANSAATSASRPRSVGPVVASDDAVVAVVPATVPVPEVVATVVDGEPEDVPDAEDAAGAEDAGGAVVTGAAVVVVTAVTTMVPCMLLCTRQW